MDKASPPLSTPQEFVIVDVVNQHEYGRGRSGTKNLAHQDAAWHALSSVLLGVAFHANGIVIHIPSSATTAAETTTALNDDDDGNNNDEEQEEKNGKDDK
eukprot:1618809-Ditylum_brightwellii.AAC.1